jgi:hypothetical protein
MLISSGEEDVMQHTRKIAIVACFATAAHAQFLNGFVEFENPMDFQIEGAEKIIDAVMDDFDGDGDPDLVLYTREDLKNPDDPPNDAAYHIRLYSNDGTGYFQLTNTESIRDGDGLAFALKAADLNDDGLPDLVTLSRVFSSSGFDDKLVILLNTGGFSFFGPIYYNSPGAYHDIAIADIDNDNDLDILVASAFDVINYHRGNGSGTVFNLVDLIETGNGSTTGDSPDLLSVADFNLDGLPDIASWNFNSRDISMLYQRPNGLFWDSIFTTIVDPGPDEAYTMKQHDVDGDNEPDLVIPFSAIEPLHVLFNDHNAGNESFPNFDTFTDTIPNTGNARDFAFIPIDCSNDSINDLVTVNDRVRVFVGLGGSAFSASPLYTGPEITLLEGSPRLLIDDTDNDGDTDIVHVDLVRFFGGNEVRLLRNRCTEPPCPADFTDDRMLTFFDVSQFLEAYNAGDPAADINDDGMINFFDVSAFLASYNKGCP